MIRAAGTVRSALRSSGLRRALPAFLAFAVAEWSYWIALLVWAYGRGGVSAASVVSVVQLLPGVVVAPFASMLGDRLPRGRALALGYLLQAAGLLGTAALLRADAPFAVVCAGAALLTCTITLTRPVHNAVLPELARDPAELVAANAVTSTAEGFGAFAGPLACGLLIGHGGAGTVLAALGGLMLVAAGAVAGLRTPGAPSGADEPAGVLGQAFGGLRELGSDPPAATLVAIVAGQYVVVGAMDILLLVLALDVLETDASGPGLLSSAFGVGGVLGGLAAIVLVGRPRLGPALATGLVATGAPLALLALAVASPEVTVLLAVSGAGKAFFDVAGRTLMQRVVPDRVLARVFGVQEAAMTGAIALGAGVAPAAVSLLGRSGALVATGALLPLLGLLGWRWLRLLDRSAPDVGPHVALLRRTAVFRAASPLVLERLAASAEALLVAGGEAVIREGEPGDRFYVVADGLVSVSRHGHDVRTLGPGDSFGEIALLRGTTRTATVRAVEPSRLLTLSRPDFLQALGAGSVRGAAEQVAQTYLDADHDEPERLVGD